MTSPQGPAKPAPPVAAKKSGSIFGKIFVGLLAIGVCGKLLGVDPDREASEASEASKPTPPPTIVGSTTVPPAPSSPPTPPPSSSPGDACARATPLIKSACVSLVIDGQCQVATVSQTTLAIDKLGPGEIVNIGVPGPEWFLKSDGTLIAVNGLASGACPGLPDVPGTIGQAMITNAAERGDSAKTYEGTFNKAGDYMFPDCSAFEIRVGRIVYHELMSKPDVDEEAAVRTAAKKAGVRTKTANEIYSKAIAKCMEALTKP